jgi:hypothetical protein
MDCFVATLLAKTWRSLSKANGREGDVCGTGALLPTRIARDE